MSRADHHLAIVLHVLVDVAALEDELHARAVKLAGGEEVGELEELLVDVQEELLGERPDDPFDLGLAAGVGVELGELAEDEAQLALHRALGMEQPGHEILVRGVMVRGGTGELRGRVRGAIVGHGVASAQFHGFVRAALAASSRSSPATAGLAGSRGVQQGSLAALGEEREDRGAETIRGLRAVEHDAVAAPVAEEAAPGDRALELAERVGAGAGARAWASAQRPSGSRRWL